MHQLRLRGRKTNNRLDCQNYAAEIKSYLDSARLITRTPTCRGPSQSEANALTYLLGKRSLMDHEEKDFLTLVEQVLPKLDEGLEDSRDLCKILLMNRDQLQESPNSMTTPVPSTLSQSRKPVKMKSRGMKKKLTTTQATRESPLL
jgi:hypothetical protein